MGNKNSGRKKTYSDTDMLMYIEKYLEQYGDSQINITKLAKFSGIERTLWYRRKNIIKRIDEINNYKYDDEIYINNKNNIHIPVVNLDSLIDENYSSKKKLKRALSSYVLAMQEFYDLAVKKQATDRINKKLKDENEKLKAENKRIKNRCEILQSQLKEIAIQSTSKKFRGETGVNNLITLDKCNIGDLSLEKDNLYKTVSKSNFEFTEGEEDEEVNRLLDMLDDK